MKFDIKAAFSAPVINPFNSNKLVRSMVLRHINYSADS